MKRFFTTLGKAQINVSSPIENRQFLRNMEKMRERCRKAEEEINKLPSELRPKPVKFDEIDKTLREAEIIQKPQSIY